MASVNHEGIIDAPAEKVWPFFADFGGLDKWAAPGSISNIAMEGEGIGAVRVITTVLGVVREKIEIFDSEAMRISYSMDNDTPLPLKDYLAIAKVTALSDNQCQVNWQSTFEPIGDADAAKQAVLGLYTSGIKGIRKHLGL